MEQFMEDSFKFIGVVNIVLVSAAVKIGLIIRYGGIKKLRSSVLIAQGIIMSLAIISLVFHFVVVADRPWQLLGVICLMLLIPIVTIISRKTKYQSSSST